MINPEHWDMINFILKLTTTIMIPAILWVVYKIWSLELGLKDRITRESAANMIKSAVDGVESKVDIIINHLINSKNGE